MQGNTKKCFWGGFQAFVEGLVTPKVEASCLNKHI